jgi:RimJ/RimL family protein N-acetyltransferase
VRTIRPDELPAFCAVNDDGWLEDIIAGFWKGEDGFSKPEWCFLLEDGARAVGRVFFYHLPSSPETLILFGLHLDWDGDYLAAGRDLLGEAIDRMRVTGSAVIDRQLYDIFSGAPDKERAAYEAAGFRCIQDKKRYVWKVTDEAAGVPGRLDFRPMTETGEDAFVEAIRRVTVDTLDRENRDTLARVGPDEHARRHLADLKDTGFRAERFHLAFLPGGKLCGLVAPCRLNEGEGAINYIGVVPEHRGHGYGYDLVLKANALLQPEGYKRVVAETDTRNVPLHAHLERAGYVHHGTLWWYRRDIAEREKQ